MGDYDIDYVSYMAEENYDSIMWNTRKFKDRVRAINEDLIENLRDAMDRRRRNCYSMLYTIEAIRLFEKDGIEISQPVWQIAYMCIVYCIEVKEKDQAGVVGRFDALRTYILAKLKPTIAAKKITKFIRSAADRIKAAKIIQKHYKEYLYKPDVYLKSEISKPARTRFQ
jgi:hypothetical protein